MNSGVYLDYAATTPVDSRVAAAMMECLGPEGHFANPASLHGPGLSARDIVERARAQVAAFIGATPAEIIWTSGATEADNLALLGAARFNVPRGRHLITTRIEHKAVLDACKRLEKEGFKVTYLKPEVGPQSDAGAGAGAGTGAGVRVEQVAAALQTDTTLVSVMHVNNETGVVNDIAAIGQLCRERGVVFHVDTAQSAGKLAIDVEAQCIDLLSLSAHKVYGPKGIGALYVRRKPPVGLVPLMFGGGHEKGLRPGTLPTHQIAGMGLACEIAAAERAQEARRLTGLRDRLWRGLELLGAVHLNSSLREVGGGVPHILNLSFAGVEGESLLTGIQKRGLAVSSGAACSSASQEASYVLRALGRSDALAQASLRFSLGRFTLESEIDAAIEIVGTEVSRLRGVSPANPPPLAGEGVCHGEAGSVEQGTWVRFSVRVSGPRVDVSGSAMGEAPVGSEAAVVDGGPAVAEARFQLYGCPDTFRAAEWLVRRLPGRAPGRLWPEGPRELMTLLQIPAGKLGRLLVLEDALRRIVPPCPSH